MDIFTAITSASKGLEVLKALKELDSEFDKSSLKLKLSEAISDFSDAKLALVEAKEFISEKEKQIADLKNQLMFKDQKTKEIKGYLYEISETGTPQGMPFCPTCLADASKFIHLVHSISQKDAFSIVCPRCKGNYGVDVASYSYDTK